MRDHARDGERGGISHQAVGDQAAIVGDSLTQLRIEARRTPQPAVQIRADEDTEYKEVATMMARAKNAGMKKVGLITTPQGT